jgi:type I restriction enzyme S subunit
MKTRLPDGWKEFRLKDICTLITDGTHRTPKYLPNGIPFISTNNLDPTREGFDFSSYEKYISEEEHRELTKRSKPERGDVLISKCGTIGRSKSIDVDYEFSIFVGLALLKIDPSKVNSKYLELILNSDNYFKIMNDLAPGSTRKTLTLTAIEKIPIVLPPLSIQQRVVLGLEKAIQIRELRRNADELTKEILKAIFFEMFGDPRTNPRNWQVKTILEICENIIDCPHSTPKYSEAITPYPCIRTSELRDGYIDWSSMKYLDEINYEERVRRLVPREGDIVYGREGTFGDAVIIPKGVNMSLGQRVMLFRLNKQVCTSEFLWSMIRSDYFYDQALKVTSGSTVGHVNVKDILHFKVLCPPLSLQEEFSRSVKRVESLRELQANSRSRIEAYYESLIQGVLKGEIPC